MTKHEREALEAIQAKLNDLVKCTKDDWMQAHLIGEARKLGHVLNGTIAREQEIAKEHEIRFKNLPTRWHNLR